MRLFRKKTSVCQNCINGNNEKGKWIKLRFKKSISLDDDHKYWHIFCEKKKKYYRWDKHKFCFKDEKIIKIYKNKIVYFIRGIQAKIRDYRYWRYLKKGSE